MGKLWEVVGGGDKGGILVREGEGVKSAPCKDRLSTGATVEELQVKGDRIQYKLVEGTGPQTGWVALRLPDKELLVEKPDADEPENYDLDENGVPKRKLPEWKSVPHQHFEFMEMRDRAAMKTPGDYYGIAFPCTKDELLMEYGASWLTKAFKKTGVLKNDNKVTEVTMKDVTGTVSGGAGLKYTMRVKYAKDEEYLHRDLFCKMPHDPKKGSDRYYVSIMWGHDRPESIFNIWLANYVPFKVPKMYFADISATSTNFCLITEQVKFKEKGTKEFEPGDIEPSYLKYADFEMVDGGLKYYMASCKALGLMAAYHKTGRLHPQINEMFPMPDDCWGIPNPCPGMDPMGKRQEMAKVDQWIRFMTETAVKAFPKELTDKAFLEEVKGQIDVILDYSTEIHCYCSGAGTASPNDYVGFTHNNLQVDNAIFVHNEKNDIEVGMLDWGAMACGPLISSIQNGCISGAQVDIFVEHRERFIQCARDTYHENGGPELDMERLILGCDLQIANWVAGLAKNTTAILKDVKPKVWPEITSINDPRVRAGWSAWAWCSQFNNSLFIYRKLGIWERFCQFQRDHGLPPRKS